MYNTIRVSFNVDADFWCSQKMCLGEDRWLCTLILQRGYRVEYSAASDAYTHCPEGFNEFYNQRRRWVPSTIANIMDLLQDAKRTIKINDNISMPYIAYQVWVSTKIRIIFPQMLLNFQMSISDFTYGWYNSWTRYYIPYVGGCLRGSFPNRQLDQFLLQHYAHSILHVSMFHMQIQYPGNYLLECYFVLFICRCFVNCCFPVFLSVVNCCPNIINRICADNDGSNRWYGSSITGGRHRFSFCDFLDSYDELVLYSGLSSSAGILLYHSRNYIFVVYSVYVLVTYFVFDH